MITRFKDSDPGEQHEAFEQWKRDHPKGFVLNCLSSDKAMLHCSECVHLAGPHQTLAEGQSKTGRAKWCSDDRAELTNEATATSLTVENCGTCGT